MYATLWVAGVVVFFVGDPVMTNVQCEEIKNTMIIDIISSVIIKDDDTMVVIDNNGNEQVWDYWEVKCTNEMPVLGEP